MNEDSPIIEATSDSFLVVKYQDEITAEINGKVHSLYTLLNNNLDKGILDLIPSYNSILIQYNPFHISFLNLKQLVENHISNPSKTGSKQTVIDIPVLYGGKYGQDLDYVAEHNHLTNNQVIEIHSKPNYLVYMLGFTPGFPYLGGMDESIATSRLTTPRTSIPAGSVGIADKQTGIYPSESPGGWRLIGKTPLTLFDHTQNPPSLIMPGNLIRFVPLKSIEEYEKISKLVTTNKYKPYKQPQN